MLSPNDREFQFKENHNDQNQRHEDQYNAKSSYSQPNENQKKVIISEHPSLGINIEEHLNRILQFYEQKILHENISKAVIGTFERKKLVGEGEFQIQKAREDASREAKHYADKIETWLGDSIINTPSLNEFERYKQRKVQERAAKINSIMNWIEKIAKKVQEKKIQSVKKQFEEALSAKIVTIPENKEYKRATYKMKFIKERVTTNRKQLENKTRQSQFI